MRRYAVWILLAWVSFAILPSPPSLHGGGLDDSWIIGLNLANKAGFAFGRDIGFTYGPLGYLTVPMLPVTPGWEILCFNGLIYATLLYSLFRIAHLDWRKAMVMALCAVTLSPYVWDLFELSILTLAASILIVRKPEIAPVALLAVLTGMSPLIRLNQGVGAVAILFLVIAGVFHKWWPAALALSSFLGLWMLKGQSLTTLPAFVRSSLEIMSGYNEAMASPGQPLPVWIAVVAIAILVWFTYSFSSRAALVPVAILAFMAFKHGVVRQDGHFAPLHLKLAAATLLAWAASRKSEQWGYFASCAAVNLALGYGMTQAVAPSLADNWTHRLSGYYPSAWVEAYSDFDTYRKNVGTAQVSVAAARNLDSAARAAIGNSTVDVVPYSIDLIAANGLHWSPRPVFQSYSAYTPYLDNWNAEHYRSARRPDRILLHWDYFDRRHPWFDDPLTWREIIARYRVEGDSNQGVVLKHAADSSLIETAGATAEIDWDQWVDVPEPSAANELVAAQLDVAPSLTGRFMTQALRGVPTMIDIEFADGTPALTIRTVRANLISGPIVSIMPNSLAEVRAVLAGEWAKLHRVRRIRLHTESPSHYRSMIGVHWIRLKGCCQ